MGRMNRSSWVVLMASLSVLLFSGPIFGWSAILLILENEGIYHEKCPESYPKDRICHEQSEALNFIYVLGNSMLSGAGLPVGLFLDRFGPKLTVLLSGIMCGFGSLLFGVLDVFEVGICLMALGGAGFFFSGILTSQLIPDRSNYIVGLMSCLFDSSVLTFTAMELLYEYAGVTRHTLFMFMAVQSFVLGGLLFVGWTSKGIDAGLITTPPPKPVLSKKRQSVLAKLGVMETEPKKRLADFPLAQQLKSKEFFYLAVFGTLAQFRSNWFLGTATLFFRSLGDASHNYAYSKLFSIVVPLGVVFVPVVGHMLDHYGLAVSLHVSLALGVLYSSLTLIPYLEVQAATSLVYTFYRALVYSALAAYGVEVFGPRNMGRIIGLTYIVSASLLLLHAPLLMVVNRYFDGDYMAVNVFMLYVCLPLSLHLLWLSKHTDELKEPTWKQLRERQKARDRRERMEVQNLDSSLVDHDGIEMTSPHVSVVSSPPTATTSTTNGGDAIAPATNNLAV